MTRTWALLSLLAVTVLLLTPPATAQPTPGTTLTITGAPAAPIRSEDNRVNIALDIGLTVQNVVCTDRVSLRVSLASATSAPGLPNGSLPQNATITTELLPAVLTFTMPAGAYGSSTMTGIGSPYRESEPVTVLLTARGVNNTTAIRTEVRATLAATTGSACSGQTIPAAQQTASFESSFNLTTAAPIVTEPPRMPGPLAIATLVAAAVAVWIGRARRA